MDERISIKNNRVKKAKRNVKCTGKNIRIFNILKYFIIMIFLNI
jgi:hypothetical protein